MPPHLWRPVSTKITPRNQLLIFMECEQELEPSDLEFFRKNSEASDIKIVAYDAILCFPLHTQALHEFGNTVEVV